MWQIDRKVSLWACVILCVCVFIGAWKLADQSPARRVVSARKPRVPGSKMLVRWKTTPDAMTTNGLSLVSPRTRYSAPSSGLDTPPDFVPPVLIYDRSRSNSVPLGVPTGSSYASMAPAVCSPNDSSFLELLKKDAQLSSDACSTDSVPITCTSTPQGTDVATAAAGTVDDGQQADGHLLTVLPRQQRWREALEKMETERQMMLHSSQMVGREVSGHIRISNEESAIRAKLKQVRFRWQRGNRIGEGQCVSSWVASFCTQWQKHCIYRLFSKCTWLPTLCSQLVHSVLGSCVVDCQLSALNLHTLCWVVVLLRLALC